MVPWANTFACLTTKLEVFGHEIYNPGVLPFSLLGAFIGFYSSYSIHKHRNLLSNPQIYTIMFFLFGCMNTSGTFVNCLLPNNFNAGGSQAIPSIVFGLLDGICSSAVSLTFIFCGLTDIGVLKDGSMSLHALLALSYTGLVYGWTQVIFGAKFNGFDILYTDLTIVGSLSFIVLSIIWFIVHKTWKGVGWLLFAVASGAVGVYVLKNVGKFCLPYFRLPFTEYHIPSPGGEATWYLLSDLSLLGLALFYFASKKLTDAPYTLVPSEKV
eukprot:TRINITY_DN1645_c0_g1_i1.p1 TRINITY_DN1645_c0_g1~~TRINITY_DN1645_c0_g1_i1.p1  ORF type:complete len:269 (+),score=74.84 TRINITY_DN1645_c0_g1_i1:109-915(+)